MEIAVALERLPGLRGEQPSLCTIGDTRMKRDDPVEWGLSGIAVMVSVVSSAARTECGSAVPTSASTTAIKNRVGRANRLRIISAPSISGG